MKENPQNDQSDIHGHSKITLQNFIDFIGNFLLDMKQPALEEEENAVFS